MKKIILTLALILPFTAYAISNAPTITDEPLVSETNEDMVERTMVVIEKINDIVTEVAICQGYYLYTGNEDAIAEFDAHGEWMRDVAADFFTDLGILVEGDMSKAYYQNVLMIASDMPNLDTEVLAELDGECVRLSSYLEDTKQLGL
jgi:hypothetical protein